MRHFGAVLSISDREWNALGRPPLSLRLAVAGMYVWALMTGFGMGFNMPLGFAIREFR